MSEHETKTALVTGATGDFGSGVAKRLCEAGVNVIGTTRNSNSEVSQSLSKELGAKFQLRQIDVTRSEDFAAIENDTFDIVVCNAGVGATGPVEAHSMELYYKLFEVNFFGVVRTLHAVLPHMRAQRSGRIIGVSSVLGTCALPFTAGYCASKFAVDGLMGSLRDELSVYGIGVHLVGPSAYGSGFGASLLFPDAKEMEQEYYDQSSMCERVAAGWTEAHEPDYTPVIDAICGLALGTDTRFHVTVDENVVAAELELVNTTREKAHAAWLEKWDMGEFL